MTKKNRKLQRVPPENVQRAVLGRRFHRGDFRTIVSDDPVYGALRAQLELLWEADADPLVPPSRGPKPKRATLLRIIAELEREKLPIRTGSRSLVVKWIANRLGRSQEQARDLLHQLAAMAEKLPRAK